MTPTLVPSEDEEFDDGIGNPFLKGDYIREASLAEIRGWIDELFEPEDLPGRGAAFQKACAAYRNSMREAPPASCEPEFELQIRVALTCALIAIDPRKP